MRSNQRLALGRNESAQLSPVRRYAHAQCLSSTRTASSRRGSSKWNHWQKPTEPSRGNSLARRALACRPAVNQPQVVMPVVGGAFRLFVPRLRRPASAADQKANTSECAPRVAAADPTRALQAESLHLFRAEGRGAHLEHPHGLAAHLARFGNAGRPLVIGQWFQSRESRARLRHPRAPSRPARPYPQKVAVAGGNPAQNNGRSGLIWRMAREPRSPSRQSASSPDPGGSSSATDYSVRSKARPLRPLKSRIR